MFDLFVIIISTALVNNLFLEHALGAETMENFSRRLDVAASLSLSLIILLPPACLLAYLLQHGLLQASGLHILRLPSFVIMIFLLMAVLGRLSAYLPARLQASMTDLFPLAGVNTAVFGALLLMLENTYSITAAIFFGLGSALGFALVLLLLTGIRSRLEVVDVPAPFQGLPITLISAGIMSLAFMGLVGLAQG